MMVVVVACHDLIATILYRKEFLRIQILNTKHFTTTNGVVVVVLVVLVVGIGIGRFGWVSSTSTFFFYDDTGNIFHQARP